MSRDMYLGTDRCRKVEKYIWFDLGKSMRRKHQSTYQDHIKYIHNDIAKTFRVIIIQYAEQLTSTFDEG